MIQITEKELLEYHATEFHPIASMPELTEYILNGEVILRPPSAKEPKFDTDLSNLTVDPETLDEYFNTNRSEILKDEQVQSYIESQRIHKANFLAEIKGKGLSLKNSGASQAQVVQKQESRKVLNY